MMLTARGTVLVADVPIDEEAGPRIRVLASYRVETPVLEEPGDDATRTTLEELRLDVDDLEGERETLALDPQGARTLLRVLEDLDLEGVTR